MVYTKEINNQIYSFNNITACLNMTQHSSAHHMIKDIPERVQQTAAFLVALLDGCSSGPAVEDVCGWSSELRPMKHILPW